MSKSKKHATPAAPGHGVGNQPSSVSAPDMVSATIYKFSEYTTPPTDASSGQQASIPGFAQSADTDNVVLVSNPDPACPSGVQISDEQVIWDCDNLTAGELQAKYAREYNSHRNMKQRCKQAAAKGEKVHPDFHKFHNFLRHMKAAPEGKYTIDRIDNDDPEYAPGKVRWADKKTQNNNKGDNLKFHDPVTGMTFTVAQLAEKHGVQPDTVRKWHRRGRTVQEIIAGKKASKQTIKPLTSIEAHGPIFRLPGGRVWAEAMTKAKKAGDTYEVQSLTAWKQEYDERAALHRQHRKDHPEAYEALLMDHETMNLEVYGSDSDLPICYEHWLELFRRDWRNERQHVIFERCSPYHQRAIEKIDPEYVRLHREALAQQAKLDEPA